MMIIISQLSHSGHPLKKLSIFQGGGRQFQTNDNFILALLVSHLFRYRLKQIENDKYFLQKL